LTKLEPLTLAWMLTIIQTPPRSNFPLFWYSIPTISLGDTTWKKLAKKTLGVPQGLGMYEYIAFEHIET
jgi:hypothetical protein